MALVQLVLLITPSNYTLDLADSYAHKGGFLNGLLHTSWYFFNPQCYNYDT